MSRLPMMSHPFLLGFDDVERVLSGAAKQAGDSYPPYDIERLPAENGKGERIRIMLAVAGFAADQLEIVLDSNQLSIRGKQHSDKTRVYLHRGIAARQFQRGFVPADGLSVESASLQDGLLAVELWRPVPERRASKIEIRERS